ncbi:oxidoreductase-like domain-containing protein [Thermomonas sp.]
MTTPADPRPIPPEKPLPMDCCDSGCERCVSDIYEEELEQYRALLVAWEARQADRGLNVLRD